MTRGPMAWVALALAALAAWALVTMDVRSDGSQATPPHEPIDEPSRAELERVLRDSREEAP